MEQKPTIRQALKDARAAVAAAGRGSYHAVGGAQDLADGRELQLGHMPSSDGGVLLGCYCYRTVGSRGESSPWKPL